MTQTASTVDAVVTIGGTAREASSVTIEREIATTLPGPVAGGGGIAVGEAGAALREPQVVVSERRSPWSRRQGWPPALGEGVAIDAVIDGQASRRFTGTVGAVSSAIGAPVRVAAVDVVDALRRVRLSQDALLATMPPVEAGEAMRAVGLTAEYVVDRVLRGAGLYATPRRAGEVWVSVPGMGSLWPESGALTSSSGVAVRPTSWGWGLAGVDATYTTWGGSMRGRALSLCLMLDQLTSGQVSWSALMDSTVFRVTVSAAKVVQVYQGAALVASFTPDPGWKRLEVVHSSTELRARTDTGWTAQVPHALAGSVLDESLNGAHLAASSGARVGGLYIGYVSAGSSGHYANATLNAVVQVGSMFSTVDALPALEARSGLDLLTEISQAMVASMWVDGDGTFWWVHPDRLRDQAPAAALTSTADLLDLAWEQEAGAARSAVRVTASTPTVTRAADFTVTVWEGRGETIAQGDEAADIITPPTEESWVMVDNISGGILVISESWAYTNPERFNSGIGTWHGGTAIDAEGRSAGDRELGEVEGDIFPMITMALDKIGPQTWKLTRRVSAVPDPSWPAVVERVDAVTRISATYAGARLPIVRAKAKVTWSDVTHTTATTAPSALPVLEHEVGPWVQGTATLQALTGWLAAQLGIDAAVLTSLPVAYNPHLALGQVLDVVEDVIYGVRLRVLVTAISEELAQGRAAMRLGARIIETTTRMNYDELAARGGTYTDLAAAGGTYDQLGGI